MTPSPATHHAYQALLDDIAHLYTETRASVVRMYREIGKRIVEVEQHGADRAGYGKYLLAQLSADLTARFGAGFSLRNLQRMRQAYLLQKIAPTSAQLGWSQQVELLGLPNARLRRQLSSKVEQQGLSAHEVRALVQKTCAHSINHRPKAQREPQALLIPKRGTPGLFQIRELFGRRYLDLGFESYRALSDADARKLKAGDLVHYATDGMLERAAAANPKQLYTYEAEVLRVVDGDTLWMLIMLTDHDVRKEKLRLRGIDCPERGSRSGDAATRFVQTQIARTAKIVITSTKPDQWDRYLSDVFLIGADGSEQYLNNLLLEHGHARRYETVSLEDWV